MANKTSADKLQEILELFKSEAITKEEYNLLKSEIIGKGQTDEINSNKQEISLNEKPYQSAEIIKKPPKKEKPETEKEKPVEEKVAVLETQEQEKFTTPKPTNKKKKKKIWIIAVAIILSVLAIVLIYKFSHPTSETAFLESFFDLYEKGDNQLKEYIESDLGLYLNLMDEYNPQGHPELISFPKVIDLSIPSNSVFNTLPKNEFDGYSGCKDGFYYKDIEASDLPSYFGKIGLMEELASSKILEVKLIQSETLKGEFCFVMIDNNWYLFYQGFYDL